MTRHRLIRELRRCGLLWCIATGLAGTIGGIIAILQREADTEV